jgi:hypothetical protein
VGVGSVASRPVFVVHFFVVDTHETLLHFLRLSAEIDSVLSLVPPLRCDQLGGKVGWLIYYDATKNI